MVPNGDTAAESIAVTRSGAVQSGSRSATANVIHRPEVVSLSFRQLEPDVSASSRVSNELPIHVGAGACELTPS